MKKLRLIHFIIIFLFIVFLSVAYFVIKAYNEKQNEFRTVYNPKKAVETAETLAKIVSKIYLLPDEIPTLATVTDKKTLPKNSFYDSAENGDKILIFPVAHKAIIYRPGANKVVNVADVTLDTELKKPEVAGTKDTVSPNSSSSAQPSQSALAD